MGKIPLYRSSPYFKSIPLSQPFSVGSLLKTLGATDVPNTPQALDYQGYRLVLYTPTAPEFFGVSKMPLFFGSEGIDPPKKVYKEVKKWLETLQQKGDPIANTIKLCDFDGENIQFQVTSPKGMRDSSQTDVDAAIALLKQEFQLTEYPGKQNTFLYKSCTLSLFHPVVW